MKITIYSTETCAYCKMLRDYLDKQNIAYEVKYADRDQGIAEELFSKSHQLGVPYTIISKDNQEDTAILGFDKPKLDKALGLE